MSDTTGVGPGGAADPSSSSGAQVPTDGGVPTTGAADPSTGVDVSTGTTGTTSGTSTGAPDTTRGDMSTSGPVVSGSSGSSGGDATTGPPPRLFDCFGCDCDADTTYCRKVFAGAAVVADPPLCPIVAGDGLESGCVVFPPDCAEPPDCGCLLLRNNDCFCNESERLPGAFEVTCPLP